MYPCRNSSSADWSVNDSANRAIPSEYVPYPWVNREPQAVGGSKSAARAGRWKRGVFLQGGPAWRCATGRLGSDPRPHRHSIACGVRNFVAKLRALATRNRNNHHVARLRQHFQIRDPEQRRLKPALPEAGCQRLFEESASAGRWDRLELQRLDQLASRWSVGSTA